MTTTRWLDDDEQGAWRRLVSVVLRLPVELERQLQHDADLGHFEYWVMALLSEAPGGRLRLSELARVAEASLSRLSHVVTRLESRGLVVREPCPDDARASFACLTDAGRALVVATAPGHVATVRDTVFDGLTPRDVADLARIAGRIVARLDERRGRCD